MTILFFGFHDESSTARHRAEAFRRLGHDVTILCAQEAIEPYCKNRILNAVHYRTGYALLRSVVMRWVLSQVRGKRFDMCFVDGGELLSLASLSALRQHTPKIVLFNHDDSTGLCDGNRFHTMRKALPGYDACLVVRPFNVAEFERLGARHVVHVFRSYDEVMHAPPAPGPIPPQFDNDVVFIGRNIPNEGRDVFLLELITQGIKPAIWGDNWKESPHWAKLAPYWKGGSISGQDYANAMHHARICLGMLSKGNRDEHTTRTMEVPFAGGLLCAERTPEHRQLYAEGREAVFWSDASECAALCKRLLAHPDEIARIKQAGHQRVLRNKVGNEDLCRTAIKALGLEELT